MMRPPSPDFDTMTPVELNDWYEHTVGYRPQVDDPTMTDDDLRKLCCERWDVEFGASS